MSYATVYLIYMRFRNTYDSENDTFRIEFLLVPVIGLSFLENYAFTPLEVSKHPLRAESLKPTELFKISFDQRDTSVLTKGSLLETSTDDEKKKVHPSPLCVLTHAFCDVTKGSIAWFVTTPPGEVLRPLCF